MHLIKEGGKPRKDIVGAALAAIAIVILGALFLGRNLGLISHELFRIIVSWQMLLVFLGIGAIIKRNYTSGAVLVFIGSFFLTPKITGGGTNLLETWWPLLLIALGVVLIIKIISPNSRIKKANCSNSFTSEVSYKSEKGFVDSEVAFGSVNNIVVDPVFKGAKIRNSFGETVLDLRRTTLEDAETYIDIDCNFGGIEIYVPSGWIVHTQIKHFLGGTEDKRFHSGEMNNDGKRVVIRGTVSFGGVEIKG